MGFPSSDPAPHFTITAHSKNDLGKIAHSKQIAPNRWRPLVGDCRLPVICVSRESATLDGMRAELSILAGTGALILVTAAYLFWHTTHDMWPRRRGQDRRVI
jgi:hypothetical protein